MSAVKVLIHGYRGQMGQALLAAAARMPEIEVSGRVDQGDPVKAAVEAADVVVDFSFHSATVGLLELCVAAGKPIVIGTTGHLDAERAAIAEAAKRLPVVYASNFSTGVNTLFWLTRKAAEILGPAFDLEVVEMHHRRKKDAPSGTAATLAEILADVRGKQLSEIVRHGREGIVGERTSAEIGMHSVRGGDVVGDHTVIFANIGERVELTHKASSRETFASGALRAALWLSSRPVGLYNMQHVLGLA